MSQPVSKPIAVRPRQEGVVLMIALIVLVAMTLAGIGIIRSIDTGGMVAGNIGFRQSAVATGDAGIEAARAWLVANATSLNSDNPAAGYYASRMDSLDLTGNRTANATDGVNWDGTDTAQTITAFPAGNLDSSGNQVYYIINRLCSIQGSINAVNQSCTVMTQTGLGSTQDAPSYSSYGLKEASSPYYRITARVNGPKNTVSYVQAIIGL
jgi:type IV pilus assembly protein PilX